MTNHESRIANHIPRHLAVIMDGNGRWAQRRRRPRIVGHRAGARAVNLCVDFCLKQGIAALTLFAFSSENWGRPEEEVGALMKLFMGALEREVDELHRRGVRIRFIGERERFAAQIRQRMAQAEALTAANTRLALNIAASYGGRQDIAHAARGLAEDVAAGRLRPEQIDEAAVAARVALADLPPPDLFIRTGGDQRISNFLLWQLAYTELWFTETLWPDLDAATLRRALEDYAGRERRFGLTGEQIRTGGAGADPAKADVSKFDLEKHDPAKPGVEKPGLEKPDPVKPDLAAAESAGSNSAGRDRAGRASPSSDKADA